MFFKGAIFDLDGTLLDSLGVWKKVDYTFLKSRGIEMPPDYTAEVSKRTFDEAAIYTVNRFSLPDQPADLVREWLDMVVDLYAFEVGLKPGAFRFLKDLKANGIRIAAATSSMPAAFESCLKHNNIYDFFDAIVMTDMVSKPKGFPDVYELAAGRIGLSAAECLVFEDIYIGLTGAKLGGFTVCGVYDKHNPTPREQMREAADLYIESYEDFYYGAVDNPFVHA